MGQHKDKEIENLLATLGVATTAQSDNQTPLVDIHAEPPPPTIAADFREDSLPPHARKSCPILQPLEYLKTLLR